MGDHDYIGLGADDALGPADVGVDDPFAQELKTVVWKSSDLGSLRLFRYSIVCCSLSCVSMTGQSSS